MPRVESESKGRKRLVGCRLLNVNGLTNHFPLDCMRADPALNNRGPDAINSDTVIAVGARFVVKLVCRSDKMMFTGNQHAALLHDVGGKAPRIRSSQYGVQTGIFQNRRTCFFIALRSASTACQQAQLTVSLTARNAKETELLNTVQRRPCGDVLRAVPL